MVLAIYGTFCSSLKRSLSREDSSLSILVRDCILRRWRRSFLLGGTAKPSPCFAALFPHHYPFYLSNIGSVVLPFSKMETVGHVLSALGMGQRAELLELVCAALDAFVSKLEGSLVRGGKFVSFACLAQALHTSLVALVVSHETAIDTAADPPYTRVRSPGEFSVLLLVACLVAIHLELSMFLVQFIRKTLNLDGREGARSVRAGTFR